MSKKLAAGSDRILLDVKTGSGAFMKELDAAIDLARAMVSIGEEAERETVALITNMNRPLGHAIGNALEVIEVVETLRGHGPEDLARECCALAAEMLVLGERASTIDEGRALAEQAIANGSAFRKLCEIVAAQGATSAISRIRAASGGMPSPMRSRRPATAISRNRHGRRGYGER